MKGNDENGWSVSNVSKGTRYTKRMYMLSEVSYALNSRGIMDICMYHGRSMKESCPDMIYKSHFTFYCIMQFVWSWILSFCSHPYCALLVMIQHINLKATLQREAYCDINTHDCTEIFFEVKKGLRVNIGLYGMK